jgi:hypothetical protein
MIYFLLEAKRHPRNADGPFWVVQIGLPTVLWVAELVVMLMVINSTWRKTILQARDGMISLAFLGPLKSKRYEWPLREIVELHVDRQMELGFLNPKLDLVFRAFGGPTVRLFTDHHERDLEEIRAALQQAVDAQKEASAAWSDTRRIS